MLLKELVADCQTRAHFVDSSVRPRSSRSRASCAVTLSRCRQAEVFQASHALSSTGPSDVQSIGSPWKQSHARKNRHVRQGRWKQELIVYLPDSRKKRLGMLPLFQCRVSKNPLQMPTPQFGFIYAAWHGAFSLSSIHFAACPTSRKTRQRPPRGRRCQDYLKEMGMKDP